jgi:hypothetical protein
MGLRVLKFPDGKPNRLKVLRSLADPGMQVVSKGIISEAEATDLFKM